MVRSDQAYEGDDLTLMADLISEGNLAYESDLTGEGNLVGDANRTSEGDLVGKADLIGETDLASEDRAFEGSKGAVKRVFGNEDWSQALTDEDLVAIDAAVESATTSLNNKRRSSSSSSPYVEIQNDAVESDAIIIRRRRLQRSLVSTSSSNPDVEIRNDAVESDPFRSRRRRLPRSIVALQNPNPVLSRCKAEAMRLPVMKFGGHILYSKTAIRGRASCKGHSDHDRVQERFGSIRTRIRY
uniref:Uncharacterized protein n=1 Tax=Fagus sylvatica TaxID=28930 RepID=A0A2N9F9Y9_FAGSY